MTEAVRLSKIMAQRGMCSRREADRFIEQGLVYVDGQKVDALGIRVMPDQDIQLDQQATGQQADWVTVLINKPLGYVSGLPEKNYRSAVMLIEGTNRFDTNDPVPDRAGLAPAGRLDIDSTGLLVFTRDGRVAKQLVGPDSRVEKEYLVRIKGNITPSVLDKLRHGMVLDETPLRRARVEKTNKFQLRFVLTEGRKRQIRRMCEQVDLQVERLTRTRIGGVALGGLPLGKWRLLKPREHF